MGSLPPDFLKYEKNKPPFTQATISQVFGHLQLDAFLTDTHRYTYSFCSLRKDQKKPQTLQW